MPYFPNSGIMANRCSPCTTQQLQQWDLFVSASVSEVPNDAPVVWSFIFFRPLLSEWVGTPVAAVGSAAFVLKDLKKTCNHMGCLPTAGS